MDQLSFIPITPQIVTAPPKVSRDEMNLAEFPLTVLSTRPASGVKTLEFQDSIRGKNGELVNRQWIITGADKFGLPTSSDDEVLLGLLKLTVADGFRDRKVYFTRYDLLKNLRWTTEGRSYVRLQRALDRLSGVRIKASNAFFDNETKSHSTRNFGLIDAYEINDGRTTTPKPSFFIWSEVLFKSFQVGFIKKFDLEFYLSLKSAVSKRLYRYLDKHFWYKSRVQINLFTLAHEKVGISRNYIYGSSLRQQLDPAAEELCEKGFLSRFEYSGKGKGTEIILYAASGKPRSQALPTREQGSTSSEDQMRTDADPQNQIRETQVEVTESGPVHFESERGAAQVSGSDTNDSSRPVLFQEIADQLVQRGLKKNQVVRLLETADQPTLQRVAMIVEHFDTLVRNGSHLVSRSPVGFLYRAVEAPHTFVLTGDTSQKPGQAELRFGQNESQLFNRAAPQHRQEFLKPPTDTNRPKNPAAHERSESEYLISRKREIQKIRADIEPQMLQKIRGEVEAALTKLRDLISPLRFGEAVEHGVEEKLAKLFALPTFDEWLRKGGAKA